MDQEILAQITGIQEKTLAAIAAQKTEWKAHYEELLAKGADHEAVRVKIDAAIRRLDTVEGLIKSGGHLPGFDAPVRTKSLGQIVTDSPAFSEFCGSTRTSGYIHGQSMSIPVSDFHLHTKTLVGTSAAGDVGTAGSVISQRVPGILPPGIRKIRVRDLLPRIATANGAVEWIKENAFTNSASPTAEGGEKPESALTLTPTIVTMKVIAHHIPASKQILSDMPQLQGYINGRMIDGLLDKEDAQILTGDGTGDNLSGLSLAGNSTAYDTGLNETGDTKVDYIRNAISQLEAVNHVADGIVMHPTSWKSIEKQKDQASGVGNYVLGGPGITSSRTLWGLPVAVSTAVTSGKFFVGAFTMYSALFDRMEARVEISTSHDKDFIKNQVRLLAEERLAVAFYRNDAFVYGTFA